jgi:hypothetical protein
MIKMEKFIRAVFKYKIMDNLPIYIDPVLGELFSFELDSWYSIPTEKDANGIAATLDNIKIIPGRDIVVDLKYKGQIQLEDFEDITHQEDTDYPLCNVLFNSDTIEAIGPDHYQFKTSYVPMNKNKHIKFQEKYIHSRVLPDKMKENIIFGDNLERTLKNLHNYLDKIRSGEYISEGFHDFEELMGDFEKTGFIPGDCKSGATLSSGVLNALGIPARSVNGSVSYESGFSTGHRWSEAYISEKGGIWVPFDCTAFATVGSYPDKDPTYYLEEISLPKFSDPNENAKIKIQYK